MEIKSTTIAPNLPKLSTGNSTSESPIADTQLASKTSGTAAAEKKSLINDTDVEKAVEKANKVLSQRATGLEFSLDEDSGKTVVKLIDKETEEILRQYPSKEMLAIAKELDKFQGSLVSEKV